MGEVSPALFQKLEKKAPSLGKNALIVGINGLHFSCDLRVFRRKKNVTLWDLSFIRCRQNGYQSTLIPCKFFCPKKFLFVPLLDESDETFRVRQFLMDGFTLPLRMDGLALHFEEDMPSRQNAFKIDDKEIEHSFVEINLQKKKK